MSLTDYRRWLDRGSPFRLMQPAADLRDVLRRHGYVVYDIGNESHMTHEPPEDHTPYSQTSYPGASVYGVGYAVDVMPPAPGQRSKVDGLPLPSLAQLGAQLVADREAGVPGIRWLKYINWEPQGPSGPCYQDSWKPNHAQRSSSDRGHIHISGLTGYESSTVGAGYDPVTRNRGGDDDMYDKDDAAVAWATTQRTAALMAGTDARYRIPGEDADRVEKNVTAAALAGLVGKVDGLTGKVATLTAAVDQLTAVVAQMPATLTAGPVSREDLEAALRSVLGSVDNPPSS